MSALSESLAERTHCGAGHAYDDANTRLYRGYRICRACVRAKRASVALRTRKLVPSFAPTMTRDEIAAKQRKHEQLPLAISLAIGERGRIARARAFVDAWEVCRH